VVANCLLWSVGTASGADYVITDSQGTAVVSLDVVAVFTGGFALLGWATLAVLERLTRRARALWTGLAIGVFALSLVPVYLVEATTLTTVFLAIIHTVVAAILVPALRKGDRPAAPAARTAA
jgi:peptidoglycan/LPS O-acetylase OafA/YrhL